MREMIRGYNNVRLYQTIYSEWRKDKAHKQIFGLIRRWPTSVYLGRKRSDGFRSAQCS